MTHNLNTVKTKPKVSTRAKYHHGDLRAALIEAGEQVLHARGADGFSLREAARIAGVSAGAPSHHFKDARGLLTAIAARGFATLAQRLIVAENQSSDRRQKLFGQGQAYVAFALEFPACFDLMWRCAMLNTQDEDYIREGHEAFLSLHRVVDGIESVAHSPASAQVFMVWSMVHGFARLSLDGSFAHKPEIVSLDAIMQAVNL
jgi:AcrR family transcriptional regulator